MSTITSNSLLNQSSTSSTQAGLDRKELFDSTDDFLTIFIEQLKNQNPLEPMESTDFIDSISRLASVEQSVNQSEHLEDVKNILISQTNDLTSGIGYLNNMIEYESDIVTLEGGVTGFFYQLPETNEFDKVDIRIEELDGTIIYNAEGQASVGQKHRFGWNGQDDLGQQLGDGLYRVVVTATPKGEGELPVTIDTSAIGVVTGVESQSDGSNLLVIGNSTGNDALVPQDSVISVSIPVNQTRSTSSQQASDSLDDQLEEQLGNVIEDLFEEENAT